MLSLKDFYKYFKNCDYNISLQQIVRMYKIYIR